MATAMASVTANAMATPKAVAGVASAPSALPRHAARTVAHPVKAGEKAARDARDARDAKGAMADVAAVTAPRPAR